MTNLPHSRDRRTRFPSRRCWLLALLLLLAHLLLGARRAFRRRE